MDKQEIKDFLQPDQDSKSKRVIKKVNFPQLKPVPGAERVKVGIDYLDEIPVTLIAELGSISIKVREFLNLDKGSVLELKRPAGEAADIYINQRRFARGEVIVIDNNFGLRVNNIYSPKSQVID